MIITVKYSCAVCGLKDRDVMVPERDPAEDVAHYLNVQLVPCITADHARFSPQCRAERITTIKIPIDPRNRTASIGAKVS